jgi:hypothetical protein
MALLVHRHCDGQVESLMTSKAFKYSAVLIAAMTLGAARGAADGIGSFTGTSTPQVITPQMTPAPQTPAYPPPPIGPVFAAPPVTRYHHHSHASGARPNR